MSKLKYSNQEFAAKIAFLNPIFRCRVLICRVIVKQQQQQQWQPIKTQNIRYYSQRVFQHIYMKFIEIDMMALLHET